MCINLVRRILFHNIYTTCLFFVLLLCAFGLLFLQNCSRNEHNWVNMFVNSLNCTFCWCRLKWKTKLYVPCRWSTLDSTCSVTPGNWDTFPRTPLVLLSRLATGTMGFWAYRRSQEAWHKEKRRLVCWRSGRQHRCRWNTVSSYSR